MLFFNWQLKINKPENAQVCCVLRTCPFDLLLRQKGGLKPSFIMGMIPDLCCLYRKNMGITRLKRSYLSEPVKRQTNILWIKIFLPRGEFLLFRR